MMVIKKLLCNCNNFFFTGSRQQEVGSIVQWSALVDGMSHLYMFIKGWSLAVMSRSWHVHCCNFFNH